MLVLCSHQQPARPLESLGRNGGRAEPHRGNFLRQQTVPVLFVVARAGAGGRDEGAGGPQVAGAGVGSAGVQGVLRGGTAPTPSSTPARPEVKTVIGDSQKYKAMLGRNASLKC